MLLRRAPGSVDRTRVDAVGGKCDSLSTPAPQLGRKPLRGVSPAGDDRHLDAVRRQQAAGGRADAL